MTRGHYVLATLSGIGGVICVAAGCATGAIPLIVAGAGLIVVAIGATCWRPKQQSKMPSLFLEDGSIDLLAWVSWDLENDRRRRS
jgi:hypothetical protein